MERKTWKIILPVLLLALLITGVPVLADSAAPAAGPSEIRLSWEHAAGSSVTVTWMEPAGIQSALVEYAGGSELPASPQTAVGKIQPRASEMTENAVQFSAELTGLEAGASYVYRIRDNTGAVSAISDFTVPAGGDSVTFGYFGDVQVAKEAAPEYAKWGRLAETAYKNNPDMSFGLMGGDIVESGISTAQFNLFFQAAEPVFSHIPLMGVNGNHESNFLSGKPELYLDEFNLPQNGPDGFKEEFYSFETGPCHITVLNSWVFSGEQKITDAQYQNIADWIDRDLKNASAPWKIIVMHHPVYPVASDNVANAVRTNWAPIFERDGVSLILCGHQHVYARSCPMTEGRTDYENGITQVMGVSGSKFYSSADETHMEKTIYNTSNYEIIRINGNELTLQCFDAGGNELDYVTLSPNSAKEENTAAFKDVSDSDWFAPAVSWSAKKGILTGVGNDLFAPDTEMTRAMFVTVLSRMAGVDTSAYRTSAFGDVPDGQWYTGAVQWASQNGIVNGTGNGSFDPEGKVTREQMAAILYRYAACENADITVSGTSVLDSFTDRNRVSGWAETAMAWAVEKGLMNGMGDGMLAPGSSSTRAQAAQLIMNYSTEISGAK